MEDPIRYTVKRTLFVGEFGNYSDRTIHAGEVFFRYVGNNYGSPAQPGNVLLSETGPMQVPFFEFLLSALEVYDANGVTSPLPTAPETLNIVPWQPQRFSMEIPAKDGTVLVRLFETEEGLLEATWCDPPRHTEAAHIFIESVIQLWNSMR